MIKYRVWKIYVPTRFNTGGIIPIEHHNTWDKAMSEQVGGLTLLGTVKGMWTNEYSDMFKERMIVVMLLVSNERDIPNVIKFTKEHYRQEAILIIDTHEDAYIE